VFPTDINLGFNQHVRHHLIHFPDPVVRPGGMNFAEGHATSAPQEDLDRLSVGAEAVRLELQVGSDHVKLGEPLPVRWALVNTSTEPIPVPSDLGLSARHARLSVVGPDGQVRRMPAFVVCTDNVAIRPLAPGEQIAGEARLFWSAKGFAFSHPGRHQVLLEVVWKANGIPFRAETSAPIWADHPVSEGDNAVAAHLLHHEVGMIVALDGGAEHLPEGKRRIQAVTDQHPDHPASRFFTTHVAQRGGVAPTQADKRRDAEPAPDASRPQARDR
jgi:hypothetical protein